MSLDDIKPQIWRRFKVELNTTLGELHLLIQCFMGWRNCHLYRYEYGAEEFDCDDQEAILTTLEEMEIEKGDTFKYEYDFGDSWEHTIKLEKIEPKQEEQKLPVCIDGRRACPPEDAGGSNGYVELCEELKKKKGERYDEFIYWLKQIDMVGYDPEVFDLYAVNEDLKSWF